MRLLLLAATIAALILPASASAAWEVYNPPDPQKVDFVQNCFRVKTWYFDPIVFPGQTNVSHNHTFAGNTSVQPNSTPFSLSQGGTNCELSRNRTSYWWPTFYANGVPVYPGQDRFEARAYYRAGTTNLASVQPVPFGLKIIAGNAAATSPQSAGVAGFQCRNLTVGNTVPKQATPPNCARGDYLEASVVFPNCWDGRNLDSADHKSHMRYASATASCPTSHSVRLPQLTLALRFPTDAFYGKTLTLATKGSKSLSHLTLHADAMFAWDPATMRKLVEHCIRASVGCEGVRDDRLPPSMGDLPPAEWPTAAAARTSKLLCEV